MEGPVSILLVYGALPCLGLRSHPSVAETFVRARAVAKATKDLSRYFAKRQVGGALRARNRPGVTDIHKILLGIDVLVLEIHRSEWEGPFSLLHRDGETCTVLTHDVTKGFRSTVNKPYHYYP